MMDQLWTCSIIFLGLLSCKTTLEKAMKYRFIDQKQISDDENKSIPLCFLLSLLLIVIRSVHPHNILNEPW